MQHQPVMVEAVLSGLVQNRRGVYLDATFGRGGHSCGLLRILAPSARLLVLDRDPQAIKVAQRLSDRDNRVIVIHSRFGNLDEAIKKSGLTKFDGILFDCGVSNPQLADPTRGFSFQRHGPLDMRMDTTQGIQASEWLNTASEREITQVLREYGEERNAKNIASAIVTNRPVKCTSQLSQIVIEASTHIDSGKHPATRTFQAIRMQINNELQELDMGLDYAFDSLAVNGRIATLTFHSLEHRLVRRKFKGFLSDGLPRRLPVQGDSKGPARMIVRKATPSYMEIVKNSRSRSAMLQIIERVSE